MTRETKIGLLVGLAFIIMIGILLSEHVSSTIEPPQAPIAQIGDNVRQGAAIPGGSSAATPVTLIAPTPTTPIQTVPTPQDLIAQPVTQIAVGRTSNPQDQSTIVVRNDPTPAPGSTVRVGGPVTSGGQPITGSLAETARSHGEELVCAENPAGRMVHGVAVKDYKAENGDTLSRMAGRLLGKNTKANRDLIVSVNPSLKANPNKIVVGQVYLIPQPKPIATGPTTQPTTPITPSPAPAPLLAPRPLHEDIASAGSGNWYTVKSGDNLTKIAREQVGSAKAVAALRELNRDILKGSDALKINMKLRLPARLVAQAH